ncbi:MAG: phosphoribosylformylglycinamidine synthase subunit PurL [Endomicrobia bacterium]|nr:phosphoribosylformylglycinamidine synthase subunit PurL [Endomicrobiia bacterium]
MKLYNTIDILNANDNKLIEISKKGLLSLSLEEMKCIKNYFSKIGRNPTDCELETIAQTWSEHCKHKTLTASVELRIKNGKKVVKKKYNNVLKETIFYATKKINHPDCLSVFEDNAGVVNFDKGYALAFKVETHNHPSALEPYGGAATGIGGVIRDIIGCGLSAKPIANTDIFCFGEIGYDKNLPNGVFHPKRILNGVVSGVRDYGNRMGIPTVNGAIIFDNGYLYNPLVYCGCLGIIPKNKIKKTVRPGQLIVLVGGKTGRDGIHGATFSSDALHNQLPTSVVQIGDPITEKMFLDVILKARDLNLFTAITDCGAGGLSSACGELTKDYGCKIYLEKVPLKYKDILPWEIWLSESQERMVLIVEKSKIKDFKYVCQKEDVEVSVIGEVTDTHKLQVYYDDELICELEMNFLHNGLPRRKFSLKYKLKDIKDRYNRIQIKYSYDELIEKIISDKNVASKEWVIRQYDHEVQGNTILKPLMGNHNENFYSPQDAAVLYCFNIPGLYRSKKAVAISCGLYPQISKINIQRMVEYSIDEAIRNLICVGVNPNKIFLLDNFCWGELNDKNLAELFLTCEVAKEVAIKFGTPFISGKDSLNNFYLLERKKISIPSTLLISAIGIIENYQKARTSYFKFPGNYVYLLGKKITPHISPIVAKYLKLKDLSLQPLDVQLAKRTYNFVYKNIDYILTSHDISEGGLITTILESCFAKNLGLKVLNTSLDTFNFLFFEVPSCIVVEIERTKRDVFESQLKKDKIPFEFIGEILDEPYILIRKKAPSLDILKLSVKEFYNIWSKALESCL